MFYEDEMVIMDEGSRIQCEVKIIKYGSRECIIEDSDGDRWEVETDRLTSLNPNE